MATKNNQDDRLIMTAQEVQRQVAGQPQPAAQPAAGAQGFAQPAVPGAMTAVTPVTGMTGTPASAAWRNVQKTGNAKTDYSNLLAAQPMAYQSAYAQPMQQTLNGLLTRGPFQYNVNVDPLYQQIKDNYIRQGRQAMMNVQGQSAALSGGYGNSYGVLAGQQAYQDSLGNLSDRIPELYQLAYQRYSDDDTRQRQNLAALQGLDESDYQRYQYDTQQYDQKIAEAYAKAHSGGSGRRRKDPREDAEWLYGYMQESGGNYQDAAAALQRENGWTPEYTDAVVKIATGAYDYYRIKNEADEVNGYNKGNTGKKEEETP
jgi:hypothetical protein